jgi:hypothetical protein
VLNAQTDQLLELVEASQSHSHRTIHPVHQIAAPTWQQQNPYPKEMVSMLPPHCLEEWRAWIDEHSAEETPLNYLHLNVDPVASSPILSQTTLKTKICLFETLDAT